MSCIFLIKILIGGLENSINALREHTRSSVPNHKNKTSLQQSIHMNNPEVIDPAPSFVCHTGIPREWLLLILCIAYSLFHTVWVDMKHLRPKVELAELQKMVESTIRPRHCGRPPAELGTSAAGSLTSDPLQSLITIDFPLAIPVIWDKVDTTSVDQRAHEVWAKAQELKEKKKAEAKKGDKVTRKATKARQRAEMSEHPAAPPRKRARKGPSGASKAAGKRQQDDVPSENDELPEDARVLENAARSEEQDAQERGFLSWRLRDAEAILLLCSAVKRLCARTVTLEMAKQGHTDLVAYLTLCAELRGASRIRPNHHFASHLAAQIERFGPMHQIWTYAGERLNYTLKSTNNNRHREGQREKTFTTAFHWRRDAITRLSLIANDKDDILAEWATSMLKFDHGDLRGTVGAETLSSRVDTVPTTRNAKPIHLEGWQADALYRAFVHAQPDIGIRRAVYENSDEPVLSTKVYHVREVVLHRRVFSMSSFKDSIITACVVESPGKVAERVGEIIELWEHKQLVSNDTSVSNTFALVRWYKASPIWAPRPVCLWSDKL
ncbi:hypothetical protein FRC08_011975 [Ceratobasidium sp. 394]|nr:hypothetical protein FRC08_011975 [Ceratobasidium sp. 394]